MIVIIPSCYPSIWCLSVQYFLLMISVVCCSTLHILLLGELNRSRNRESFSRTSRSESGYDSISGTTRSNDFYCFKLVGAELIEDVAEA